MKCKHYCPPMPMVRHCGFLFIKIYFFYSKVNMFDAILAVPHTRMSHQSAGKKFRTHYCASNTFVMRIGICRATFRLISRTKRVLYFDLLTAGNKGVSFASTGCVQMCFVLFDVRKCAVFG